jgi:hypothetical protein
MARSAWPARVASWPALKCAATSLSMDSSLGLDCPKARSVFEVQTPRKEKAKAMERIEQVLIGDQKRVQILKFLERECQGNEEALLYLDKRFVRV